MDKSKTNKEIYDNILPSWDISSYDRNPLEFKNIIITILLIKNKDNYKRDGSYYRTRH